MYKIMTKLHTTRDNIFAFHMVYNDNDELVEYAVDTPEEAANEALKLLGRVGYEDLRIVNDDPYYLELVYGVKPMPEPKLYTLIVKGEGVEVTEECTKDIEENSTATVKVSFNAPVFTFHLMIDGVEYNDGLPKWITYDEVSESQGELIFSGITSDHEVVIVIDEYIISA